MVSIDTPVAEWLEGIVADAEEKCEILSDLLGDNLSMKEFTPANMDDDMLGAARSLPPTNFTLLPPPHEALVLHAAVP